MSATGIGARVRRTEDQRFITGRGQYTDDIHRPYETYCCFVRSPHAHATIKSIDKKKAEKMPGVLAILTGDDVGADKLGDLFCGWMVFSKDGSPMNAGSHPALAKGKVRYVGDHVAVVIAETLGQAKTAAAEVNVSYGVLPAVADLAKARDPKSAQIHENAPNNTVYEWVLGDADAVNAAFITGQTRHQAHLRQ
jgi:aerobic carbon-monoxide dehydrogenase large subunit